MSGTAAQRFGTSPQSPGPVRVAVGAAFFETAEARWLDDFIADDMVSSYKVPAPGGGQERNWHAGRSKITPIRQWWRHMRHGAALLRGRPDAIITCFPQLSVTTALLKRVLGRNVPIIAYNFNLGGFPKGPKQWLAAWAAKALDLIIVHSPTEVSPYADYLGMPVSRVRFIPLQRGEITEPRDEETEHPFLLAMGSAHRDYESLIEAVRGTDIRTIIVTRATDIETLPKAENVEFLSDLSAAACMTLMAQARLSVTPVDNMTTASGQITFITAMRMGVPVIATDCPGIQGYITPGETGLLVSPRDAEALRRAIQNLWHDPAARLRLAEAASREAKARFSDEAAAEHLHQALVQVMRGELTRT